MLGPFATASRRTPIHQVSLLSHARIDVHDNNDNAWQRGSLWPNKCSLCIGACDIRLGSLEWCRSLKNRQDVVSVAAVTYCVALRHCTREVVGPFYDSSRWITSGRDEIASGTRLMFCLWTVNSCIERPVAVACPLNDACTLMAIKRQLGCIIAAFITDVIETEGRIRSHS